MKAAPRLAPSPRPQDFSLLAAMLHEDMADALRDELKARRVPLSNHVICGFADVLHNDRDAVYTRMLGVIERGQGNQAVIGMLLWSVGPADSSDNAAAIHRQIKTHNHALYMAALGFAKFCNDRKIEQDGGLNGTKRKLGYSTQDLGGVGGVAASVVRLCQG